MAFTYRPASAVGLYIYIYIIFSTVIWWVAYIPARWLVAKPFHMWTLREWNIRCLHACRTVAAGHREHSWLRSRSHKSRIRVSAKHPSSKGMPSATHSGGVLHHSAPCSRRKKTASVSTFIARTVYILIAVLPDRKKSCAKLPIQSCYLRDRKSETVYV